MRRKFANYFNVKHSKFNFMFISAGFLLRGDTMIAYASNGRLEFDISDSGKSNLHLLEVRKLCAKTFADILLLAHFIESSPSLLTHDQNWIPICLPAFNAGGYLQVLYFI